MRSISTDYSQNPQQKMTFFIYFCLIVSSIQRMLPFDVWPSFSSNNLNASLVPILAGQSYSRLNVVRLQFFPPVHLLWFLFVAAS